MLGGDCPSAGFGCTVANIYYEYEVDGKTYDDVYKKPFIIEDSGKLYAKGFARRTKFKVRVNPEDTAMSVPLAHGVGGLNAKIRWRS